MSRWMRGVVTIAGATSMVLWGLAGSASADCSNSGSFWDWDHCWSGARLAFSGVSILFAGWACANFVFRAILAPDEDNAPWPREAFGRSLALFFLATGAVVLAFFAYYELYEKNSRIFPVSIKWLSPHWRWVAVVGVDLVMVTWALTWFRHREASKAPSRPSSKKGKVA